MEPVWVQGNMELHLISPPKNHLSETVYSIINCTDTNIYPIKLKCKRYYYYC